MKLLMSLASTFIFQMPHSQAITAKLDEKARGDSLTAAHGFISQKKKKKKKKKISFVLNYLK